MSDTPFEQSPGESVLQLRIGLNGSAPEIWRRIAVSDTILFDELHNYIQAAMGWENCHLYLFRAAGAAIGPRDIEDAGDWLDAETEFIADYLKEDGASLVYEYDLSDGWQHTVLLERSVDAAAFAKDQLPPICLDGQMACPPEDCGGIAGYQRLLVSLNDPLHPEYQRLHETVPPDFDPQRFSVEDANQRLWESESRILGLDQEAAEERAYGAVIVVPKAPFAQWLRSSVHGLHLNDAEALLGSDLSCWLIPPPSSFENDQRFEDFLNVLKVDLFKEELRRWVDDEKAWPTEISAKSFDHYFALRFHSSAKRISEISGQYEQYFQDLPGVNPAAREAIMEVVNAQLAERNPREVYDTYNRLSAAGIGDKESRRLIACAFAHEMWSAMQSGGYNPQRYAETLNMLPDTPWLETE